MVVYLIVAQGHPNGVAKPDYVCAFSRDPGLEENGRRCEDLEKRHLPAYSNEGRQGQRTRIERGRVWQGLFAGCGIMTHGSQPRIRVRRVRTSPLLDHDIISIEVV